MAEQAGFDVREHYIKYEYRIPMRDGVRLFTSVLVPTRRIESKTYPILLIALAVRRRPVRSGRILPGRRPDRGAAGGRLHLRAPGRPRPAHVRGRLHPRDAASTREADVPPTSTRAPTRGTRSSGSSPTSPTTTAGSGSSGSRTSGSSPRPGSSTRTRRSRRRRRRRRSPISSSATTGSTAGRSCSPMPSTAAHSYQPQSGPTRPPKVECPSTGAPRTATSSSSTAVRSAT